jgi:hypothetical protein
MEVRDHTRNLEQDMRTDVMFIAVVLAEVQAEARLHEPRWGAYRDKHSTMKALPVGRRKEEGDGRPSFQPLATHTGQVTGS